MAIALLLNHIRPTVIHAYLYAYLVTSYFIPRKQGLESTISCLDDPFVVVLTF